MDPIPSTAEILVFRMLERNVDERWTAWAYNMVVAGFDHENLIELAGETAPYNQFELRRSVDKVFAELGLTWTDRKTVYHDYVSYLVSQTTSGDRPLLSVLDIIKDIYIEQNHEKLLQDFYFLYWAHDDLSYQDQQYYWDGATRENIDDITRKYFAEWIEKYSSG